MNVPKEIYLNILHHIGRSDLKECSMVCKNWSLPALQRYYNKLSFNGQNVDHLISILIREQHLQYCHWVEKLTLDQEATERISEEEEEEEEENYLTKELLLKFLTYLPKLKSLDLFPTHPNSYYLDSLLELDEDKYLTQLEEIRIGDRYKFDPLIYDYIYYKFRASIKKLHVIHQEPESIIITKYGGIINYLNQFKRLTHLKYDNCTNQDVTVYQLQVACPNLTTLELSTSRDISNYQAGSNAFFNISNLQSLELAFPRMSANYVDMLIDYLPTRLNKLCIQVNQTSFYDWINVIGLEKVLKLAERMSKLLQAEIRCDSDGPYDTEPVYEEYEMTLFFKILNAFKGNKKVYCIVDFSDDNSIFCKSMVYSKGFLNVYYKVNNWDFDDNQEFIIPDKTVSIIGLDIFNQIRVFADIKNNHQFLKYILINCPRLQVVDFIGTSIPYTYLRLSTDTGPLKGIDSSTKTKEDIKVVKLWNFVPSTEFLHMLATCLPNIFFFTCEFNHEKVLGESLVDLSEFRNLETFNLEIDFPLTEASKSDGSCNLKINYTDGQEDIYQYKQEDQDIKLVPISSDTFATNQASSVVNIFTSNYKKSMKLVVFSTQKFKLIEINNGIPQEARSFDINYEGHPNLN